MDHESEQAENLSERYVEILFKKLYIQFIIINIPFFTQSA